MSGAGKSTDIVAYDTVDDDSLEEIKSHLEKQVEDISDASARLPGNEDTNCLSIIKLLRDFGHHYDARVRCKALSCFLRLHQRGIELDISLYGEFLEALSDDYERCRLNACRLLVAISQNFGNCLVLVAHSDEQVRLEDDVFSKLCTMITDPAVEVRTEAARLLACLRTVSITFLQQTLDKKLMSNLRRKKSAHERGREAAESGEWSTGQRWADDAPKEFVCPDTVNLINIGSCGAFVHGLEDEMSNVRMASLESLCQLAEINPSFAEQSMDFIVDMFNDEIEEIRLTAIQCLTRISHHKLSLRQDQTEIILSVIEDFSMDIREALHEMLAHSRFSSEKCLLSCIESLTMSLRKYPQDRMSIFKCFQSLGLNHPVFTSAIVNELLAIHPYLDLPEQSLDDQNYIATLILVFNAALKCPKILNILEKHTLRHYAYMCDTLQNFVPPLQHEKLKTSGLVNNTGALCLPLSMNVNYGADGLYQQHTTTKMTPSYEFFLSIFSRLRKALKSEAIKGVNSELLDTDDPTLMDYTNEADLIKRLCEEETLVQNALMQMSIQDLVSFGRIEPDFRASATFYKDFIECLLILRKILSQDDWIDTFLPTKTRAAVFVSNLQTVFNISFSLLHRYHRLNNLQRCCIQQIRVKALAIQLIAIIHSSNTSALDLCENFMEELDILNTFMNSNKTSCKDDIQPIENRLTNGTKKEESADNFSSTDTINDTLIDAMLEELSVLDQPKPGTVARILQPMFLTGPLVLEQISESLKIVTECMNIESLRTLCCSTATINEPVEKPDSAYKYTPGLVTALTLDAIVENIVSIEDVRVKVVYPNQQAHIVVPMPSHFRLLHQNRVSGTRTYRLYTSINICHMTCYEAYRVELSLILDFRDHQSSAIDLATKNNNFSVKCRSEESQIIELCDPIRLHLFPRAARWSG